VGVAVLLPLVDRFTRLVERILPQRGSPLTRALDPSALATPIVAVEAVRRTIALTLAAVCGSIEAALLAQTRGDPVRGKNATVPMQEAADALRQAQLFLSDVAGPPDTDDEQLRLTSTMHALDHASRLAETAGAIDFSAVRGGPDDLRAGELCAEAMRITASIAEDVAAPPVIEPSPEAPPAASGAKAPSADEALVQLERRATELENLQRTHRSATLGAVADGTLTADAAITRVDTLRSLHALARHAWRSAVHLAGPPDK
jgi:phosphate:Na+ symporter